MQTTFIHFTGHNECKYTLNGENIAAMRRASLRRIANQLKVPAGGTKNEILQRLIMHLKTTEAPLELSEQ